jgi:hypothetical protein
MASKRDQRTKQASRNKDPADPSAPRVDENSIRSRPTPTRKLRKARDDAAEEENTIRVRRAPTQAPEPSKVQGAAPDDKRGTANSESRAVPEHINARYIKVGNKYHFTNGDLAFADRGRGLTTRLENTEVIRDLLAIAQERGWKEIALGGSERFRKEAWQQANLAGLTVRGYRPSELERAQLVRLMGRERGDGRESAFSPSTPAAEHPPARPATSADVVSETRQGRQAPDRVRAGRLIDHGTANYQFDRHADLSYYVKIETPEGERTLWGKDLQRAVEQSLSRASPGDEVVVRQLGTKPVTINRPVRDDDGRVVDRTRVQTHLNRWSVERSDFLKEREQVAQIVRDPSIDAKTAASRRPELAGTYTELHAAKLIAQELFVYPADRERFITRVREAIADEIERGEPLSAPRVRGPAPRQQPNPTRTPEHAQERVLS